MRCKIYLDSENQSANSFTADFPSDCQLVDVRLPGLKFWLNDCCKIAKGQTKVSYLVDWVVYQCRWDLEICSSVVVFRASVFWIRNFFHSCLDWDFYLFLLAGNVLSTDEHIFGIQLTSKCAFLQCQLLCGHLEEFVGCACRYRRFTNSQCYTYYD